MGRKKLTLAYISDDTVRKASFKHRKNGLMKKLDELKIICDVEAFALIYDQFDSNLEVWPSNSGAINVMEKFEMLSETEKSWRSVNHEGFLSHGFAKLNKKSQKLIEENKEAYMRELMFGFLGGRMEGLSLRDNDRPDLCNFIDQYLKNLIHHKNVTLNNLHFEIGESSSMAMAKNMAPTAMTAVTAPPAMAEAGSSSFVKDPIFNSPQRTNDFQTLISSNQRLGHDNSLASNPLPSSNQEVYIPVMNQDEFYYPYQNQNQQQGFVEEMIKIGEQTGFPWMEDNQF